MKEIDYYKLNSSLLGRARRGREGAASAGLVGSRASKPELKNKIEIEMKILELPRRVFLEKMRILGAKKIHSVFIRIRYFDFPDYRIKRKQNLLRVREFTFITSGKKKTEVVYKVYRGVKRGCKRFDEHEFEIEGSCSFEAASDFLKHLGFVQTVSYEKKRTLYSHRNFKFEFDEHPKIPSFLEIEAPSEREIHKIIKKLGLSGYEKSPETIQQLLKRKYPKISLNKLRFNPNRFGS